MRPRINFVLAKIESIAAFESPLATSLVPVPRIASTMQVAEFNTFFHSSAEAPARHTCLFPID